MPEPRFRVTNYALLLKPRVMSLVVFTAAAGMFLAPGGMSAIQPVTAAIAVLCIAIGAGASGAINMWYDRDIDLHMLRTRNRPLPAQRLSPEEALVFGVFLSIGSVAAMAWWVNILSSALLAATILYYVFIYTVWLKRRTPHNIVIGGASGALPPVIGWAAVTGDVGLGAIVLFAIIFLWTPPHTWALALFRRGDYEAAGVPMLPVVAGELETKRQMLIYTAILVPVTLLPTVIGMSGVVYAFAACVLGAGLARHAWRVWKDDSGINGGKTARPMFFFTILYLFLIFAALLADRMVFFPVF
ncbi:MAG: protoheme IX farnesyltransferase [Rhodospirillales bacterium]|nr:protoheme IX farnesyltransferase [Alphaproteobacteria bacterium]MBL6947691.1 protoheme IX farnesyltransferase [Rhodospirillales bacterium]